MARRLVLRVRAVAPRVATAAAGSNQRARVLFTLPRVILTYVSMLLDPWLAGPAHRVVLVLSAGAPAFYLLLAVLAALAAGFLMFVRNNPRRRLYLFCAAWIWIPMVPAMYLPVFRPELMVEDRYLYLSSMGWCVMIAVLALDVGRRTAPRLAWVAPAALVVLYAFVLWDVEYSWHDDVVLTTRALSRTPEVSMWHEGLAQALARRGDLTGAERELRAELAIEPRNGGALYNLGRVHERLGLTKQAGNEMARGLELQRDPKPGDYLALAEIWEREGDGAKAADALDKARKLNPDDAASLFAMGHLDQRLGRTGEAAAEIAKALELTPRPTAPAYADLAELYDAQGNSAQSDAALKHAESLPGGVEAAGLVRARIAMRHGDPSGAETTLRQMSRLYPGDPRVWTLLGLFEADQNRAAEGLADFDRALELAPANAITHFFAARMLHKLGRDPEALDQCRKALAIAPDSADARELMEEISGHLSTR